MQVDPLIDRFVKTSGYTGMGNNPVTTIDPDGMERVFVTGDDADKAVEELQDETALDIDRNPEDGELTTDDLSQEQYNNLSDADKALYNSIKDEKNDVVLNTKELFCTHLFSMTFIPMTWIKAATTPMRIA